jgi:hypothetical protein
MMNRYPDYNMSKTQHAQYAQHAQHAQHANNRLQQNNMTLGQVNQNNQFVLDNKNNGNIGNLDIEFERTKSLTKHIVLIDSQDRNISSYPTQTSYKVELPVVYKQIKKVRLLSMEISSSFYIFKNEFNNTTLHIGVYDSLGTTKLALQEIILPDGNYDNTTIGTILTSLLNQNTLFISEGVTFNVYLDAATFLLNITNTSSRKIYIDTTYASSLNLGSVIKNWGLEYYLGFAYDSIIEGISLKATQLLKLNPYNYLLLDIKELNRIDECNKGQYSAFAKIPITINSFDLISLYENCCTFNQAELNPYIGKLSSLTINWRFHDNTPINFNNVDHSFTLELECLE